MDLYLKAALSGIFFGLWPLVMNKSGLSGNVASLFLVSVALLCIAPFAVSDLASVSGANWKMGILAGVLGATAFLLFNAVLAKATAQNIGTIFVWMIVIQIMTPIVYQILQGGVTFYKGLGFIAAIVAAILLSI